MRLTLLLENVVICLNWVVVCLISGDSIERGRKWRDSAKKKKNAESRKKLRFLYPKTLNKPLKKWKRWPSFLTLSKVLKISTLLNYHRQCELIRRDNISCPVSQAGLKQVMSCCFNNLRGISSSLKTTVSERAMNELISNEWELSYVLLNLVSISNIRLKNENLEDSSQQFHSNRAVRTAISLTTWKAGLGLLQISWCPSS